MMENKDNKDVKHMSLKEFREGGYLQEVNRCWFHPMGLALEVTIDDEDGSESLSGIWDERDDPEGIIFGTDMIDPEKCLKIFDERNDKCDARQEKLGYRIQPIPSS